MLNLNKDIINFRCGLSSRTAVFLLFLTERLLKLSGSELKSGGVLTEFRPGHGPNGLRFDCVHFSPSRQLKEWHNIVGLFYFFKEIYAKLGANSISNTLSGVTSMIHIVAMFVKDDLQKTVGK